ncbi:MAG: ABC transporter substrate-binding protein [Terracidiphilus sp.]
MRKRKWTAGLLLLALLGTGCHSVQRDPSTVVFLIESSPASLDPRVGTDFASEHIDELLFDGLVRIDEQLHFQPALAQSWNQPDPKTMVFHLRQGVHFSNGRLFTSRDVVWTFASMGVGGTKAAVISPKAASYVSIQSVEAPDAETVVFHLRQPDNFLLTNLSSRAIGIVPDGSGKDFWRDPVGTGPFRFVSQRIDQDVVIERNPMTWQTTPKIARVRFAVVPDAITESLELEKGSADVEVNSLPMDALPTLATRPDLEVSDTPGTEIQYLAFNTQDPILRDARVRQAIACAIDRNLIIRTIYHGYARPAVSLLPPTQWAWTGDVARYEYDPARAEQLLDEAGYRPGANGIRLHLSMKTSTDERARLLGAVFQQQLAHVGIALDLRSNEFATFYSDVVRGAFQMYSLYWIGGNEQPDIFDYVFSSARIPPHGANRGRYINPQVDALLDDARQSPDMNRRRADYVQVQQILARDLPSVNLWYIDTLVVHNRRLTHVTPSPSGSYSFLETAELVER